jgi:hypothetical protein
MEIGPYGSPAMMDLVEKYGNKFSDDWAASVTDDVKDSRVSTETLEDSMMYPATPEQNIFFRMAADTTEALYVGDKVAAQDAVNRVKDMLDNTVSDMQMLNEHSRELRQAGELMSVSRSGEKRPISEIDALIQMESSLVNYDAINPIDIPVYQRVMRKRTNELSKIVEAGQDLVDNYKYRESKGIMAGQHKRQTSFATVQTEAAMDDKYREMLDGPRDSQGRRPVPKFTNSARDALEGTGLSWDIGKNLALSIKQAKANGISETQVVDDIMQMGPQYQKFIVQYMTKLREYGKRREGRK